MAKKPKPLRQSMPLVTAFIDEMRKAFGAETIDTAIRNGLQGGCDFYACENGHEIGNRRPDRGIWVTPVVIRETPAQQGAKR